ncbi:MAG: helix-turn-helix transcriptional regulator [Streptosporangiaceae bacterium]|nr:helix-turn-helix transcriptional regulator [Streptosporangiaceae bacterium]MBV9854649.1 helix-turn-helix transcriptional regulator [Streptosporangiaceae bacterium]
MSPVFRHGRLRLYLLRLLDEEPRHGYEVIRLLRDRFMGIYAPSPGTIYPRLARLEEEGLVTHDEVDGRKVYRITEAGREELRNRGDELDELEEELSASVSDIVREVKEDVRDTVRSLREELTWAAREMRRTEKEAAGDARQQDQGADARAARESAWAQARQARDSAWAQAREQARQVREQARQARDEARERAQRSRDEARERAQRIRDEARGIRDEVHAQRYKARDASEEFRGAHEHAGHEWGGWPGWGDWSRWTDWPGRRSWPGPHDMTAFRDLERLAREFATDLRKVAWESGAIGGDVLTNLRGILEEALERIRTEIFGAGHADDAEADSPSAGPGAAEKPSPSPAPDEPTGE